MTDALPSPREPALRKRLGQYFTGERLGGLVAALGGARRARSIVDPMGGAGDLLLAAAGQATRSPRLHYLELDPAVADLARARFASRGIEVQQTVGNAFDPDCWSTGARACELVVANPPYVRYQSGASVHRGALRVPDAESVRRGLITCLETLDHPSSTREAFLQAARDYSGLSDLAVPAWILCCARVTLGGSLAILVPNTWLTRDYAKPVLRLLTRFFELSCIVDDRDQSWFDDALVRTSIVAARRVEDRGPSASPHPHPRISVAREAQGPRSVVENCLPGAARPDLAFASSVRDPTARDELAHVESRWSEGDDIRTALAIDPARVSVPERLLGVMDGPPPALVSLAEHGWRVGQGLRTGANDFFYVSPTKRAGCFTSPILPGEPLRLPADALRPTLRRQADLEDGLDRVPDQARTMTLVLEGWALPEDASAHADGGPWRIIDGDLARLVRAAAHFLAGKGGTKRPIPQLSAVRTNVRPGRFWYQLPTLAPRHAPALFVARVNHHHPRVMLNPGRAWLIDSNFSTLWPTPEATLSPAQMQSLLSSPWALACMELRGSVMGGGALKLEAAHLRELPLPAVGTTDAGPCVDFDPNRPGGSRDALRELLAQSLAARSGGKSHLIRTN